MSKTTKVGRRASFQSHCARPRPFPFARIRTLAMAGQEDRALDVVFERINDMLCDGHFAAIDRVLHRVALTDLTPVVALGYLTIAWPAWRHLANFVTLRERIRPWMAGHYGEERTTDLLTFRGVP